ncbi:MAG: hypothetical protein KGJ58_01115 [Patescibacteria group bacterium]|nr:hypothetical protein [Patescibacteria group bacterium]
MKLQLNYKGKDYIKIEELVGKAYADISSFFKDELGNLIICVHKGRKEFDKKLSRQTKLWEVANVMNGQIDIIHIDYFEKESSHKTQEFFPILKHEITHLFIERITSGKSIPRWLNEGLASFVSGQHKDINFPIYIERDFCEKLGTPKGWDDHSSYDAYNTSSLFVSFLVQKYTLDKLIKLISRLERNYYHSHFKAIFKDLFEKDIEDLEKEFVDKVNLI